MDSNDIACPHCDCVVSVSDFFVALERKGWNGQSLWVEHKSLNGIGDARLHALRWRYFVGGLRKTKSIVFTWRQ